MGRSDQRRGSPSSAVGVASLLGLRDAVEEASRGDVEAVRDLRDDLDAGVAALRLDAGDVGHVQVGEFREALLRQAALLPSAVRTFAAKTSRGSMPPEPPTPGGARSMAD